MNLSHPHRRVALIATLLAMSLCGAGFVSTVVGALAAGSAPAGGVSLNPSTGDSGVTFGMSFATVQACPGDAPAGYLWGTFLTSAANDPAALTFTASGSPVSTGGFTTSLRDPFGAPIRNKNPNLVDGIISPPNQVSFSGAAFASVPPGDYWIGIACTKADANSVIQNVKYWMSGLSITSTAGAGPNNFTFGPASTATTTTTTTTTTIAGSTTTTTIAGATTTIAGATTTSVAGATTTTVAGATTTTVAGGAATLTPAVPTAGAAYKVTHPSCRVGDTITVAQPQSTPTSATATCALPVAGLVRPEQAATIGTATVTFTAAPTVPGTYTVTSTGATSGTRTTTFTIAATSTTFPSTGGIPAGGSSGTIPQTGSSTMSIIVWGILLLAFGRMAILFGRKPKVISANR